MPATTAAPAGTGPSIRRLRTALAAALVALLLAAGGTPVSSPHAAAQVPGGQTVAVATITAMQPSSAAVDDVLTLRGVVRNTSDGPLGSPVPVLRWSSDPVQTSAELDLVATNPLFRYGRADYRYSQTLDTLDPGESEQFTLRVPLGELGALQGVYVVGIDVLATLPSGLRVFVASSRTTLPVAIARDDPLPTSLLWPLSTAPVLLPDGRLVDDQLAAEIAPGGRLSTLVTAGADAPVTWVVDPDLVVTTAAMVNGYRTVQPDGDGTGASAAAAFLADLASVLSTAADVWTLPAADPDVGGAVAAGVEAEVMSAVVAGTATDVVSDLVGRALPSMALLVDRPVTEQMLAIYQQGGVDLVVLDDGTVADAREGPRRDLTLDGATVVPGLVATSVAAATGALTLDTDLAAATPPRAQVAARQDLLSRTAVLATSPEPVQGAVLAPAVGWQHDAEVTDDVLAAWADADWVDPVPLSAQPTTSVSSTLLADGSPVPVEQNVLDTLDVAVQDAARLGPLFVEPPLPTEDLPATQARALSYAWQSDAEGGSAYADGLSAAVTDVEAQIGLVVSESITLSSRSGRFPVTLVNDSDADIAVGVQFTSQNTTRLRVQDIEPVALLAGEKRTVTATALATANGRVPVRASLVTVDDGAVAAPVTTVVDVTNVGALGWTVIAGGGVLLVVALLRGRRRRRTPGHARQAVDGSDRSEHERLGQP